MQTNQSAVLVRGRIGLAEAVSYWAAQIAGGLIAAGVVGAVVPAGQGPALRLSGRAPVAAEALLG